MKEEKQKLRKRIALQKRRYNTQYFDYCSKKILDLVEKTNEFQKADCVLLYYALKDEVQTEAFIEKWYKSKRIILPVVVDDYLVLKEYKGKEQMHTGAFNIQEPTGENFTDYNLIDLAIIPGVAFDLSGNRLGRGKGYYDRLLPQIKANKIGICYPFQYLTKIPCEALDIPMNRVITIRE